MPAATITITTMMTTTTITERQALLRLLAWLSPAFPTGAFAYSHGLEWAVEAGDVTDGESLRRWVEDVLRHGSGRSDLILLRHAHRNAARAAELGALFRAMTPSRERRDEAIYQGRAFVAAVAAWGEGQPDDSPYAVAVGAAAFAIGEDTVAVAYLQAFAANLISAAVRLVPLGQTTGLRVLAALEPTIIAVADETQDATLEDIGGCAFRSDLAAMRHETQYTRLFRS